MNFTFEEYIKDVKSQLECNASEEYKKKYVVYTYSNEDVDNNLDYFKKMYDDGYSAYKALLLFSYKPKEEKVKKEPELNNSNVIKNISTDQSEILKWIMDLYNDGQPFECDITASELKFYGKRQGNKYEIPVPKILMDVFPMKDEIIKITPFNKLPLEDNSVSSIVCDLPFVCSPKTCKSVVEKKEGSNLISNRFSSWYPMQEGYENIYWWINECKRVLKPNGILVWKMQNSVSGGLQHLLSVFSAVCAADAGLYIHDVFSLEAKARLISASKIKKQQHARKYTSDFWVLRKDPKRDIKTNILIKLQECKNNVYEGKVWEIK